MNISLKSISVFAFALVLMLSSGLNLNATTYYTAADGDAMVLSNRRKETSATGKNPASCNKVGNVFNTQNGDSCRLLTNLSPNL